MGSQRASAGGADGVARQSRRRTLVRAAGSVVWRENGGELEVLLVHRPRYDDWSFPKGKVEAGEALPACAVREVAEETGVQVVLGQPLTTQRYKLGGGARKEVSYWAGRAVGAGMPAQVALAGRPAVEPASPGEIDEVVWAPSRQARKMLTRAGDRDLLGEVVDLWEDGKLATWTLVLVRHARAVKRSVWNRPTRRTPEEDEATRPLTSDQGEERARALVPILAAFGVSRVVTSPWRRCADTVAPYAAATGVEVETEPAITEHAHAADSAAVRAVAERMLRAGEGPRREEHAAVALCTHRPVLPTVMEVVAEHAPGRLLRAVPEVDPWLKTGEVMVIHLARRRRGRVRAVAIEKQRPTL